MAFDIDRARLIADAKAGSRLVAARAVEWSGTAAGVARRTWDQVSGQAARAWGRYAPVWLPVALRWWRLVRQTLAGLPFVRPFSQSLTRRIILSNLIGLAILLIGYLYMNQYKDWLVDAKLDSLTAQGEIIAQAIAGNATLDGERIRIDPDNLPEAGPSLAPFRDDGFAALSFSIGPEKITPILRRLLQPEVRARVFDRDGRLLVDSDKFLGRGKKSEPRDPVNEARPKTKDLWTRMTEVLFTSELPVLKDLDQTNGNFYPPVRNAMSGTGTPMLLLDEESQQIVAYAAPIQRARQISGVLLLSTEPGEIEKVLSKERNAILRLAGLALLATLAASLMLAYSVATPIRRLSEAANEVSHNINARHHLPDFSGRKDEVGQLAQAFSAMTASLFRRIEASEKFAADVAHELKNPLTAARSTAESLSYARTDEQRDQLVLQIQLELKRLNRLITDVSNASRLEAELALQEREPVDLAVLLAGIVATFRDIHSSDSRQLEFVPEEHAKDGLVVLGHEGRLGQIVTNLLDNALSFSPPGGTVTVRARRHIDTVEFVVEDEGPGIDAEKLETVFDRFYTYRPSGNTSRGNNSGLGLAITREIVRAHEGRIWAENRSASGAGGDDKGAPTTGAGRGARFTVQLPAAHPSPRAAMRSWRG